MLVATVLEDIVGQDACSHRPRSSFHPFMAEVVVVVDEVDELVESPHALVGELFDWRRYQRVSLMA